MVRNIDIFPGHFFPSVRKPKNLLPDAGGDDHHAHVKVLPALVGEVETGHRLVAQELRDAGVAVDLEAEVLDHAAQDGVPGVVDLVDSIRFWLVGSSKTTATSQWAAVDRRSAMLSISLPPEQ